MIYSPTEKNTQSHDAHSEQDRVETGFWVFVRKREGKQLPGAGGGGVTREGLKHLRGSKVP